MRPTGVEGLWGTMNTPKKIKLEGGYLYRISPRSTLSYYDIGKLEFQIKSGQKILVI
jgi:hypothetical protein